MKIHPVLNIAAYQFVALDDLTSLREYSFAVCEKLFLKGTVLLAPEGINLSLAGKENDVRSFQHALKEDNRFAAISFHESFSDFIPFKRLKIKLKKEIITFRQPDANPLISRAPAISPEEFKTWYDDNREMTVLDTRNDFEYQLGTFQNAVNLHLDHFDQLPEAVKGIDKNKPVVMFCTGGVRCEKAALYMQQNGFKDVRQLDGGILGYFAKVGGEHYNGDCFVFDERQVVDASVF